MIDLTSNQVRRFAEDGFVLVEVLCQRFARLFRGELETGSARMIRRRPELASIVAPSRGAADFFNMA